MSRNYLMGGYLRAVLAVLGAGLIVAGIAQIHRPSAWIAAGAFILADVLLARILQTRRKP